MAAKTSSIILVLLCTIFTSFAQILYKLGVNRLELNIIGIITNYYIIIGLFLYVIGAALLITALKGGELSTLYPIIATSYIWVSILSIFFFNEIMNTYKWLGIFSIVIGVSFINCQNKDSTIHTGAV